MNNMKRNILLLTMCLLTLGVAAQTPARRYVAEYGKYENDGTSWETPKSNIQDAINSLIEAGGQGEVWVAQGTYKPTESTESTGGSTLYMSFKIPAGITVHGGFYGKGPDGKGDQPTFDAITDAEGNSVTLQLKVNGVPYTGEAYPGEASLEDRVMRPNYSDHIPEYDENGVLLSTTQRINLENTYYFTTTLSGDLSQPAVFKWNDTKNYWDAAFYGNCYHVVWFAMNGFDEQGRAKALNTANGEAAVEGCTIMNGNAHNNDLSGRPHNAYGGGVYMVEGSRVENCRIVNCEASRDGGGVYMDGGGVVKHCYVENCQALGIAVQNGYGGGVCMEGNKMTQSRYGIYRSAITGCVGRLGGGLAIKCDDISGAPSVGTIPPHYLPFASAVLVANNTATTEGGGIYTLGGGAMTNMTVVRNECNGTGVISNNVTTGRSGGIYCRGRALIMNSVMWGNSCAANGNLQYAATAISSDDRVQMKCCALSLSDAVDWSATTSSHVFSLSTYNDPASYAAITGSTASKREVFPNFYRPSAEAGWYQGKLVTTPAPEKPGYNDYENPVDKGILRSSCWLPGPNSGLANAGIVSHDLNDDATLPFVSQPTDILDRPFTAFSTLGAYIREFSQMTAYEVTEGSETVYHFFVDPNAPTSQTSTKHGQSWTVPARYLNNVLHTIANDTKYSGKRVYIHVKEGTMTPVNSYRADRIRNISFSVPSNVTLRGGYPEGLTGTSREGRNPLLHPTILSGAITDDYDMNTSHILTIKGESDDRLRENITIDGFQIRYGHASSDLFESPNVDGAGLVLDMARNVKVLNVVVAGCTARQGAAVYLRNTVNAQFENCIFHNNEARSGVQPRGVVFSDCTPSFRTANHKPDEATPTSVDPEFRHCNVLNNVGYGTWLAGDCGQQWENSMFFANWATSVIKKGDKEYGESYIDGITDEEFRRSEEGRISDVLPAYSHQRESGGVEPSNVSTANAVFTAVRSLFDGNMAGGFTTTTTTTTTTIPAIYYENSEDVGVEGRNTQPTTWLNYRLEHTNYPRFVNGVKSVGVTLGGDVTFYGRATSFEPHNDNPMVNAATYSGTNTGWGTDLSTVTLRDYGGAPDIGAVENHIPSGTETSGENAYTGGQPAYGQVIYVKTTGSDSNDGLSWNTPMASVQAAIERAAGLDFTVERPKQDIRTETTYKTTITSESITSLDALDAAAADIGTVKSEPNTDITTGNDGEKITTRKQTRTMTYFQIRSVSFGNATLKHFGSSLSSANSANVNSDISGENTLPDTTVFFSIEKATNGYKIKTFSGGYLRQRNNNTPTIVTSDANNVITINQNGSNFTFQSVNYYTYYLRASSSTSIQWSNSNNNTNYRNWSIKKVTATVETTTITTEKTTTETVNAHPQVWVAAGTYTQRNTDPTHALYNNSTYARIKSQRYSIMLREGVNVYGGFPANGSPGFEDRDPKDPNNETIVQPGDPVGGMTETQKLEWANRGIYGDYPLEYRAHSTNCGSYGRVVVQGDDFATETVFDGFTITNGYLNTTCRVVISGALYTLLNQYSDVGNTGGSGVYLMKGGVLENCTVRDNMTYANPENTSNNAATAESNNQTYMEYATNVGSCHTVGAGVYNNGGTIKNCNISHNIILYELERRSNEYSNAEDRHPDAAGLYGAGLYQEDGTVYNTIIHDNILKVTNMKGNYAYFTGENGLAHDDPYTDKGKQYNEFWPTTYSDRGTEAKDCNQYLAGAGVFLVRGKFYNNTVVNNTYRLWPTHCPGKTVIGIGGVYAYDGAELYNCIIADNEPETPKKAGIANPYKSEGANDYFLRNGLTTTTYKTYLNFPIICFNTNSNSYSYADNNLIVKNSAVDYKSAAEIWDVTYPTPIRNQCLNQDDKSSSAEAYIFNTTNSYGYAANNAQCNYSGTNYSGYSGTNWYGKSPTETEDRKLYDPVTYELTPTSWAMNNAREDIEGVTIPDVDANYTDRIKDCRLDMGAYEYNHAYAISPQIRKGKTTEVPDTAVYYVTPYGRGTAGASDPQNAACASKLQKVLDAAGRYKFQNPNIKVVVKVANDHVLAADGGYFPYYATRTTDQADSDVRIWSIIVPRGVEVWGGYTDTDYVDETNNGFYVKSTVDGVDVYDETGTRNITENATYFHSYYNNQDNPNGVYTYHVVTFTDKVFDADGKPYLEGDEVGQPSSYSPAVGNQTYLSMKSAVEGGLKDRAVVDGIHIIGGQADLEASGTDGSQVNINRYGGAAIVTDYAHVRNCIVRDNEGVYGGALALTHGALVTGCLIDRNTAEQGGAIYVFKNGTVLSDGTRVETVNDEYDPETNNTETRYDLNMPRILSTTIVNNRADVQGGGVWFEDNARFNSVVVWHNECPDQANVRGLYNVTRPSGQPYMTTEYYPFNFSAVQDITPSGINNVSASGENKKSMRFRDELFESSGGGRTRQALAEENKSADGFDRLASFGYYKPSTISILIRGGMPLDSYNDVLDGGDISATDFMGVNRTTLETGSDTDYRRFIEIGALANDARRPSHELMLRLYVAHPEDVDEEAEVDLVLNAENYADDNTDEEAKTARFYSQQGSSFAHPFARLQDALDYIYQKRGLTIGTDGTQSFNKDKVEDNATNLPFEIWLGPGVHKPSVDLTGNDENVQGNSFLIPEGVSLVGGFDPEYACDAGGNDMDLTTTTEEDVTTETKHFWGRYDIPKSDYTPPSESSAYANGQYYVANNVTHVTNGSATIKVTSADGKTVKNYVMHHVDKDICNKKRKLADVNANSVVEPWEFAKQTILSGEVDDANYNGVHHIVTIMAHEDYTGGLPSTQGSMSEMFPNHPDDPTDPDYGYVPHEHGQIIAIDGITFKGGYAYGYQKGTVDDAHKMRFNHGGAILVDGNRYKNSVGFGSTAPEAPGYKHGTTVGAAGYREIPLMVNRCKFENNHAGYGGAISSNTTLDLMNCSFEHNKAMSGNETVDMEVNDGGTMELDVKFPGAGGAVYGTYQVSAINTLFANNEAYSDVTSTFSQNDYTILSDLVANNGQGTERTLYGGCGGAVFMGNKGHFHFMNCNFVRNQANVYPAIFTMNPNYYAQSNKQGEDKTSLKDYNQVFNSVFWGNEVNKDVKDIYSNGTETQKKQYWAANQVVNYGRANRGTVEDDGTTTTPYKLSAANIDKIGDGTITKGQIATGQAELDAEYFDSPGSVASGFTETIWFSAYEEGKGKTPKNLLDLRDMTFHPRVHVKDWIISELERMFKEENDKLATGDTNKKTEEQISTAATSAYQNCNILLATDNSVNEGPNFVNPSNTPGYDGYMESADWSPARLNNLSDNGWGKIKQKVSNAGGEYSTTFLKYGDEQFLPTFPEGRFDNANVTGYSSEDKDAFVIEGAYSTLRYLKGNEKYQKTMPIGDEEYMYTTNVGEDDKPIPLYRISKDPNPSHGQTYVDIGVYEYNHTQLQYYTEDEVDILWVSPIEKPDNGLPDGSAWSQPTSDLQRAIETLLASRNGHRKEIRLMDGTFTPIYTIGDEDRLAFYINTELLNGATMLEGEVGNQQEGKGVMSLTIKGGYSYELENIRNVDEYPAIIRQQQSNGSSPGKWDYLFYIDDPTQRYGKSEASAYTATNGYGHHGDPDGEEDTEPQVVKKIYTIPIEFDGVTLINDQARPGTQGAAIHYSDLSPMLAAAQVSGNYDSQDAITSTPANMTRPAKETGEDKNDHYYTTLASPPKITISKSKIIGSGATEEGTTLSSAVYLGNHGRAVMFNNVLHTNSGKPLVAACEAYTVNNTFALNGGPADLMANYTETITEGETSKTVEHKSSIHNSVFWKNNKTAEASESTPATYGDQFRLNGFNATFTSSTSTDGDNIGTMTWTYEEKVVNNDSYTSTGDIFSHNSYTGGPEISVSDGEAMSRNNHNTSLSEDNDDFMGGPNFADPENADVEARSFMPMPSLHLMNRGDDGKYEFVKSDGDMSGVTVYDFAYSTTYDEDAASNDRFADKIDIGAYEYQSQLDRVLYVDPTSPVQTNNGTSWAEPFGYGQIQQAIDLAALYHSTHETQQAFVFVKGAVQVEGYPSDFHTNETLTLRNGVSIFGGVQASFGASCEMTELTGENGEVSKFYADDKIETYLQTLGESNEGFVGPNSNLTAISGIKTSPTETYSSYQTAPTLYDPKTGKDDVSGTDERMPVKAQIMGFHVTNPDKEITAPVINIAPTVSDAQVALRQIAVYDNNYASDATSDDVAVMQNSLIYGALFRDNKPGTGGAVLRLNEGAYAVNISAQGQTVTKVDGSYKTPYNGHGKIGDGSLSAYTSEAKLAAEKTNRIINSIVNYDGQDADFQQTEDGKNAITDQTKYTLTGHNYRRKNRNLYFQLTEGSKHINEIAVTTESDKSGGIFPKDNTFQRFVNYDTDRDIMGNPRVLTLDGSTEKKLDRGAFETWRVATDYMTDPSTHQAPHPGSVVYIMENSSLTLGTSDDHPYRFRPGFLLLKDGASLYGNGVEVDASYVAVERRIPKEGAVVSMPFEMDYQIHFDTDDNLDIEPDYGDGLTRSYYETIGTDGTTTTFNPEGNTGILHLDYDRGTKIYKYNGGKRMEPGYQFNIDPDLTSEDYNGAWEELQAKTETDDDGNVVSITKIVPANQGVLIVPDKSLFTDDNKYAAVTESGANNLGGLDVPENGIIYSFTAKSAGFSTPVYRESAGETFKTVTLTQHDDRESTGGKADFTAPEDMGWNCIGLPYLVSDYQTHGTGADSYAKKVGGSDTDYNMHIPHTMWLYYNGKTHPDGNTAAEGTAGYYSVDSWDATKWHLPDGTNGTTKETPHIWWGEGIFMQTAAVNGTETVKFYRPVKASSAGVKEKRNVRYYMGDEIVEELPQTGINITAYGHTVVVTGLQGGETVCIYDPAGRQFLRETAPATEFSTHISAPGVYIVKVNAEWKKVLIK